MILCFLLLKLNAMFLSFFDKDKKIKVINMKEKKTEDWYIIFFPMFLNFSRKEKKVKIVKKFNIFVSTIYLSLIIIPLF